MHAAANKVCGCEAFKAVPTSPGRVRDDEILHLLVSDPQHLLGTREIDPVIATQIDQGGLSVLRGSAADSEFTDTIEALRTRAAAKGADRYLHGVLSFKAEKVRYVEQGRLTCVYDTAMSAKPNHADIMGPTLSAEKEKRVRIKQLIELIGTNFEPVATFRGGVLAGYARPAPAETGSAP